MPGPTPRRAPDPSIHERLLDLAEEASFYLRRHREPSVRVAAALLLVSSLAACSPSAPAEPEIAPLAREVRDGLPIAPGRYPVDPTSLARDEQGVYSLAWRDANAGTGGPWNPARASLVRLAEGLEDVLEIPTEGDPILYLRTETPIALPPTDESDAQAAAGPTPTPESSASTTSSSTTSSSTTSSSTGSRTGGIFWYPFPVVGGTTGAAAPSAGDVPATTPAYRNPPAYSGQAGQGAVRGANSSLVAPSASARTWTASSRRSGQSGGTGTGSAVSGRSGALDGPAGGAARPSSSGFSGGTGGSSGSSGG